MQIASELTTPTYKAILPVMLRSTGTSSTLCPITDRVVGRDDGGDRQSPRCGRNEKCLCGSGRKFKRCHGAAK